jgi:hypothetical protein
MPLRFRKEIQALPRPLRLELPRPTACPPRYWADLLPPAIGVRGLSRVRCGVIFRPIQSVALRCQLFPLEADIATAGIYEYTPRSFRGAGSQTVSKHKGRPAKQSGEAAKRIKPDLETGAPWLGAQTISPAHLHPCADLIPKEKAPALEVTGASKWSSAAADPNPGTALIEASSSNIGSSSPELVIDANFDDLLGRAKALPENTRSCDSAYSLAKFHMLLLIGNVIILDFCGPI